MRAISNLQGMKAQTLGRVKDIETRAMVELQGVGNETRFSKDNWESMYFLIF
jgi:hypothetical protein